MGSVRLGKQKTFALMIALKCLGQTPGIDGRSPVTQLDIQVNHEESPTPFWVHTYVSGVADKYYVTGEFDWDNLGNGGSCTVSQVTADPSGKSPDGKLYTNHEFRWEFMGDRLEVALTETTVV